MIRIIHLSDLHLNTIRLEDWNNYLKESLLSAFSSIHKNKPIDFIIFTGDLIDKGGKDFNKISECFKLFEDNVIIPITDKLQLPKNRFIFVPGNHDIDRSQVEFDREKALQLFFKKGHEEITNFMHKVKKDINNPAIKRIIAFKEFEKNFFSGTDNYHYSIFNSSLKFKIGNSSVGFCLINSSWRCNNNKDANKLLIGENNLLENIKYISDTDIKIALVHHPIDWISSIEKDIIQSKIQKNFNILLIGHLHKNKTTLQTGVTDNSLFINISPSGLYNIRTTNNLYNSGFSLIDYKTPSNIITCSYYKYNHLQENFVINVDVGVSGSIEFKILQNNDVSANENESDLNSFSAENLSKSKKKHNVSDNNVESEALRLYDLLLKNYSYLEDASFFEGNVFINKALLYAAVVSCINDLKNKENQIMRDRHTMAGYIFKWLSKMNPIQFDNITNTKMLRINSFFATYCAMSFLDLDENKFDQVSPEYFEHLQYLSYYYNISGKEMSEKFMLIEKILNLGGVV